jgi:hypothetical protein
VPGEGSSCPSQPGSEAPCQCVCGGAVLGEAAQFDVGLDVGWSLPVMVTDTGVALAVAVENDHGFCRGRCCAMVVRGFVVTA